MLPNSPGRSTNNRGAIRRSTASRSVCLEMKKRRCARGKRQAERRENWLTRSLGRIASPPPEYPASLKELVRSRGLRTSTPVKELAPQASASTSSAMTACFAVRHRARSEGGRLTNRLRNDKRGRLVRSGSRQGARARHRVSAQHGSRRVLHTKNREEADHDGGDVGLSQRRRSRYQSGRPGRVTLAPTAAAHSKGRAVPGTVRAAPVRNDRNSHPSPGRPRPATTRPPEAQRPAFRPERDCRDR